MDWVAGGESTAIMEVRYKGLTVTLGHSRLKNYSAIAALAKSLKMKPQKLSRLLGELKLKIAKEYPELDAEMPDHMDTTALLKEHFSGSQIT